MTIGGSEIGDVDADATAGAGEGASIGTAERSVCLRGWKWVGAAREREKNVRQVIMMEAEACILAGDLM